MLDKDVDSKTIFTKPLLTYAVTIYFGVLELLKAFVTFTSLQLSLPISRSVYSSPPLILGKTYFYAELPNGDKLFHRIQKNFGREVMADEQMLNKPESVDWRNCKYSKEQETSMAKQFQKAFTSFDFNACQINSNNILFDN